MGREDVSCSLFLPEVLAVLSGVAAEAIAVWEVCSLVAAGLVLFRKQAGLAFSSD